MRDTGWRIEARAPRASKGFGVQTGAPDLCLKIPCDDEGEFHARLADHAAERGLRVATEAPRPVGSRVTLALELRNGGTLVCEGIVDAHVRMDARPGVNVKIVRFPPRPRGRARTRFARAGAREGAAAGLPAADEPLATRGPAVEPSPAGDEPLDGVRLVDASPAGEGPAEEVPFLDAEAVSEVPPVPFGAGTISGEIVRTVQRRASRFQRAAVALAVGALLVGAAGLGVARWLRPGPEAAAAAHVEASDRLLAEGRLTGKDGALEHLLAAKRLRPDDPATNGRLSRIADLLEGLAARALERGDVAVAKIHLAAAQLAAPERASIRARREAISRRTAASGSPAPPQRRATGGGKRATSP